MASFVTGTSDTQDSKYITSYTPPRPWYRPSISLRTYILFALPLLSLLGAFGTWSLGSTNGTFRKLFELVTKEGAQLPGTNDDLIKSYTGVTSIDSQLTILVTFFAPLTGDVTRENAALHLLGIFGIGQFGAVWCMMVMESLRMGNKSRRACLVGFGFLGVVGIIFQNISYTITTPLWLFAHLLTSPVSKPFPGAHANSVLLIPAADLQVLPLSVILGYLVPTIAMGLPTPEIVEPETHQYLIAFWQAFPIWTVIIHCILRSSFQFAVGRLSSKNKNKQVYLGTSYLANAKHVYKFALGLCMLTHIPVLLIALLPANIFPTSKPHLAILGSSTFSAVYVPYFPFPLNHQVPNLAEGVQTFLLWDLHIGSIAFLLWAVLLYRNATTEKAIVDPNTSLPIYRELKKLGAKIVVWTLVSGPVGALTMLLWERDTIVRQKIKQGL